MGCGAINVLVQIHVGNALQRKSRRMSLFHVIAAHEDDAVYLFCKQRLEVFLFTVLISVTVTKENAETVFTCGGFNPTHHRYGKNAVQAVGDQRYGARSAHFEAARDAVRLVFELADRVEYPCARLFTNVWRVVKDLADRSGRNACKPSNISDGYALVNGNAFLSCVAAGAHDLRTA